MALSDQIKSRLFKFCAPGVLAKYGFFPLGKALVLDGIKMAKIFSVFFVLAFGSLAGGYLKSAQLEETEAGFSFECPNCRSADLSSLDGECFARIKSERCRDVAEGEKASCRRNESLSLSDAGEALKKCFQQSADSFLFVFDLLWYAIQYSASLFFNEEEAQSSAKGYIAIEFYKAYREAEGSELEKALSAGWALGGRAFSLVWDNVLGFIEKEYEMFACYKPSVKASIACSFFVGLIIPGGGAFGAVKLGMAGLKRLKSAQKLFKSQRRETMFQEKSLELLSGARERALGLSSRLPAETALELSNLFDRMDSRLFAQKLKEGLRQIKPRRGRGQTNESYRKQVEEALRTALVAGGAGAQLPKEALSAVTEGLTDTLATAYISEQIISAAKSE